MGFRREKVWPAMDSDCETGLDKDQKPAATPSILGWSSELLAQVLCGAGLHKAGSVWPFIPHSLCVGLWSS